MKARLIGLSALLLLSACGGTNGGNNSGLDAGNDAGSCVTNPQTNLDLLNACTDAGFVNKTGLILPLLQADGGLPPLP